ncbi:DUF1289 domain-containing protein [Colwellia asteriadis]|uniref:DUF1289 domain-containing protein n=1 Tax=Colwellia asteriadis TaxID=517723 RepID=UPI0031D9810D
MKYQNENPLEITSPCVGSCCLNECDICLGCFRHIEEIKAWRESSNEEKKTILKHCQERKYEK